MDFGLVRICELSESNSTIAERRWEFMRPKLFLHGLEKDKCCAAAASRCGAADTIVALRAPAPRRAAKRVEARAWLPTPCGRVSVQNEPLNCLQFATGRRRGRHIYWQANHT